MNKRYCLGLLLVSIILFYSPAYSEIYKVVNSNDNGPGSLRQAIDDINARAGADTIVFNIPTSDPGYDDGRGIWTIALASALAQVTDDSTWINGSSQRANQGDTNLKGPEIQIDGAGQALAGFWLTSAGNVVQELIITRCSSGIRISSLEAHDNKIIGNYIGLDGYGTPDLGVKSYGVYIHRYASNTQIGGADESLRNVISGNEHGFFLSQADHTVIIGNYIGTDPEGKTAVPNWTGINVTTDSRHTIIGGPNTGERNIISGNNDAGINLTSTTSHTTVRGNYIGVDVSGKNALGNRIGIVILRKSAQNTIGGSNLGDGNLISGNFSAGATVDSDSNLFIGNYVGTDLTGTAAIPNKLGLTIGASYNKIGGVLINDKNVISGNIEDGILIAGNFATHNEIAGNYIGVGASGEIALGNGYRGINIVNGAKLNIIGGTVLGAGNVISANSGNGLNIYGSVCDSNTVAGNYIGTDQAGTEKLGNQIGIWISYGARDNTIGPNNRIYFNNKEGIGIYTDTTIGNTVSKNSISANAEKGIKLAQDANAGIMPPVISNITATEVSGTAAPNSLVEIFSDPAEEGKIFEGAVPADGTGNFTWSGICTGPNVTATATDAQGNTSEFSSSVSTDIDQKTAHENPLEWALRQNYPNPFNARTTVSFCVKQPCPVTITIYDLSGREYAKLVQKSYLPGTYKIGFDAGKLPSGIYIYKIRMETFEDVKKMVLIR